MRPAAVPSEAEAQKLGASTAHVPSDSNVGERRKKIQPHSEAGLMLIGLSFAASRCSTFSGPTIEAAMPATPADPRRRWQWAQL